MGCFRSSAIRTGAHRCLQEVREFLKLCDYLDGAWKCDDACLRWVADRIGLRCYEMLRYFADAYGFCFHVACLNGSY